jgi:hypothetical protein
VAISAAGGGAAGPGSFREAGRNLAGRFGDDSRTIRGRFEGVLAAEARSGCAGEPGEGGEPAHRRLKTAAPLREFVDFAAGAGGGDGSLVLAGSFRDPSGKLAGTLRDGSGTFWRRKRGQTAPVNRARGASRHIGG